MSPKLIAHFLVLIFSLSQHSVADPISASQDDGSSEWVELPFDIDSSDGDESEDVEGRPELPLDPVTLDASTLDDSAVEISKGSDAGRAPRVIRYLIGTQYANGVYQGTFDWAAIHHGLNFIGRYKNVVYQRVNSGAQLKVLQANTQPDPTALAWTRGSTIYISPVMNFGNNSALCKKVMLHENGHFVYGRPGHNPDPSGIMSAHGGTAGNLIPTDYRWFAAMPWRDALRPEHEPERMRQEFSGQVAPLSIVPWGFAHLREALESLAQ